ncbi:hypothetical protein [Gordonia sihwensis]|uniref:hypothetical protein n=1 Tax=Gordonia sihwensis TaxID=173559 RepID=UPI003D9967FB
MLPGDAPTELTEDALRAEAGEIYDVDISGYTTTQVKQAIEKAPAPGGWSPLDPWEDWDGRKRIALENLTNRDLD